MDYWPYIIAAIALSVLLLLIRVLHQLRDLFRMIENGNRMLAETKDNGTTLSARQDILMKSIETSMNSIQRQLHDNALLTEQKLDHMRRSQSENIDALRTGTAQQLDLIRKTVDEKLQDALDKKLTDSFKLVSERLEQVYKGLGEMQNIATGVGDLKKVLSNVKTRGVLGEIQLGAILEQVLSPEQYAVNVATKKGSRENVEYAVKLPGNELEPVWLPIDAKFPLDAYEQLLNAYDTADPTQVDAALKTLKLRVRGFAKDVHDKYIDPPNTTEFAVLFLPTEGLYAELVRAGMIEQLQNEFRVNLAGPTTMGAFLNSLQMGFKTLAIQKYSSQVWKTLGSVKNEFESFASVLEKAKQHLNMAGQDLDTLSGVRTRQIQRALRDVESASEAQRMMEDQSHV